MKKICFILIAVGMFAMNISAGRAVEGSCLETIDQSSQAVPVAMLSKTLCDFGNVYMGEKVWSETVTLKNVGSGVLKIPRIIYPSGCNLSLDLTKVELQENDSVSFKISYMAHSLSETDYNFIFKTNGGDVPLRVVAKKVELPKGAVFEGFENGCSPVGWASRGWLSTKCVIEGDYAASAKAVSEGACELTSPRLDLSQGRHKVRFAAFNKFDSEVDGVASENDVTLQFSKDGGATWSTVWTSAKVNEIDNVTVDLGKPKSDNCYLKWVCGAVRSEVEKFTESSAFYLDKVILPRFYGAGDVPSAAKCITPANGAVVVFEKEVKFEWEPVLFATNYRIYVGTNEEANDVLNGESTAYDVRVWLRGLAPATKYYWKVVPYNEKGDAQNVETWSFTTGAEQTGTK